jgi:anti-sigma B factor antagonist
MVDVDLSIRDFDGQAVVALRGAFNLADTPCVASHLIAAVAACGPSVTMDLAGLEGIGYSGLSVLLRVRKWTRQSGGDLRLAAPQEPVRRILEVLMSSRCIAAWKRPRTAQDRPSCGRRRCRSRSVPPRSPGPAAGCRYAALPVIRWSGRCPGAERADPGTWRVTPALNGARREGQRHVQREMSACRSRRTVVRVAGRSARAAVT